MLDACNFVYYSEVHSVSFETMVWVLNHSDTKGSDRLVLLALASHQNGRSARPGTSRLACEAGVDLTTVFRSLRRLEEAKAIEIMRAARGRGRTSQYYVLTERMADCHHFCCREGGTTPDIETGIPGTTPDTPLASRTERVASSAQKDGTTPGEPLRASREPLKAHLASRQVFQKPGGVQRIPEDEPRNPHGAGAPCLGDPCPGCGEAWTLGHRCEVA